MKIIDKFKMNADTPYKAESYKVHFGEKELAFRFSLGSTVIYFDRFGKNLLNAKSMKDRIDYLYSAYLAGCAYENTKIDLTVIEFYNLLDDYPLQFVKAIDCFAASQVVNKKPIFNLN
jgi:hypothetical protein